jgi:hypothetical protein
MVGALALTSLSRSYVNECVGVCVKNTLANCLYLVSLLRVCVCVRVRENALANSHIMSGKINSGCLSILCGERSFDVRSHIICFIDLHSM